MVAFFAAKIAMAQPVNTKELFAPPGQTDNGVICWKGQDGTHGKSCESGGLYVGTVPSKRIYIPIRAGACAVTTGCTAAAQSETSTNKINYFSAAFATSESWMADIVLPLNYQNGGTFTVSLDWIPDSDVTGGSVGWVMKMLAIRDNVAVDTALGTGVTVTDAWQATGRLHQTAISTAITAAGTPVAGDHVFLQVARNTTALTGGASNKANLVGFYLTYPITKVSTEN